MLKTSIKDIREFRAVDITYASQEELDDIVKKSEGKMATIAISTGVYGRNGSLYCDLKNGIFYKVCSRSTALFYLD